MNKKTFSDSDAWLLTAIALGRSKGSSATLQNIIVAADYLNHAIITWEELEEGLRRLISAGYVTRESEGFKLSEVLNDFWVTKASKKQKIIDAWSEISRFIEVSDTNPRSKPTPMAERIVPKTKYHEAVKHYVQRMKSSRKK